MLIKGSKSIYSASISFEIFLMKFCFEFDLTFFGIARHECDERRKIFDFLPKIDNLITLG